MTGWLHMLWRALSASLLFFVMCCHLMTSVGAGQRGEKLDRSTYVWLCEIFAFSNDWFAFLVGMF